MAAGVHFSGGEAFICGGVFLRDRQGVDIGPQHDAALFAPCRGGTFDHGIDAGARNAPVGDPQLVKLLLDGFLGLKLLLRKLRMLMEPAAERDNVVVILEHLVI